MKITEHLKVDAESFFNLLKESVVADIAQARGKKAKPSNVHEGYSYKKYLGGRRDAAHAATVRIERLEEPSCYRSTVTTSQGTSTIGYDIASCPEGGIDVTYIEEFESISFIQKGIQQTIGLVRSLSSKKRVRAQLQAIEGRILADAYPAAGQAEGSAELPGKADAAGADDAPSAVDAPGAAEPSAE